MDPYTMRGGHHSWPDHTRWGVNGWLDRLLLPATAWPSAPGLAPSPSLIIASGARGSSHWCSAAATDLITDLGQKPVGLLHQVQVLRLHRS